MYLMRIFFFSDRCLWEMFCTICHKVNFKLCIPADEIHDLENTIQESYNMILDVLMSIDVEKADAANQMDKIIIFDAIKKDTGFNELNNVVRNHLRHWYIEKGCEMADRLISTGGLQAKTAEFGKFLVNLGISLKNFDKKKEAMKYFNDALETEIIDENRVLLYISIGEVYVYNGEGNNASSVLDKAIAICDCKAWPSEKARALNIYAMLHNNAGPSWAPMAIECGKKAYELQKTNENFSDMSTTYNNLGNAYIAKRKYTIGIQFYKTGLDIALSYFGHMHPLTAKIYNNLGNVYTTIDSYEEAHTYLEKALHIRVAINGKHHSCTIRSYQLCGHLCVKRHKYADALEYFFKALESSVITMGRDNFETGIIYLSIAEIFEQQEDKFMSAINYYGLALKIFNSCVGTEYIKIQRKTSAALRELQLSQRDITASESESVLLSCHSLEEQQLTQSKTPQQEVSTLRESKRLKSISSHKTSN